VSGSNAGWLLGSLTALVAVAVLAAIVYNFLTRNQPAGQGGTGISRQMLALVLVGGLMVLTGAAFTTSDTQSRNLLVGGVVASAASAVAFYFASRSADSARQDVLSAIGMPMTETVPHLVGLTVAEAQALVSKTSLALETPVGAQATAVVTTQTPAAGTSTRVGSKVTVT
jgi:hypothetical protein